MPLVWATGAGLGVALAWWLQLLIAAPEVARADGNTTYRLVRRMTDSGTEEVVVSGRRAEMPELGGESSLPARPDKPLANGQQDLWTLES